MSRAERARFGGIAVPIALSILFHIGAVLYWGRVATRSSAVVTQKPSAEPSDLIELFRDDEAVSERIFPDEVEDDSLVVRTEDARNRTLPNDTHFFGEHDQMVEEQTRAARSGDFESSENMADAEHARKRPSPPSDLAMSDLGIEPPDSPTLAQESDIDLDPRFDGAVGFDSATNDFLPEIPFGDRTLLSTREYAYWGYLQRIRKYIAPQWTVQVQAAVNALAISGQRFLDGAKLTKLLVELDRQGTVSDVSVTRSSGSRALDMVAVRSFRDARTFPNPPAALVRPDDTVRLRWTFVVNVARPTIEMPGSQPAYERRLD